MCGFEIANPQEKEKKKKKSQFEKSHVYQQDRTLCEESFKVFS